MLTPELEFRLDSGLKLDLWDWITSDTKGIDLSAEEWYNKGNVLCYAHS